MLDFYRVWKVLTAEYLQIGASSTWFIGVVWKDYIFYFLKLQLPIVNFEKNGLEGDIRKLLTVVIFG